MQNRHQPPRLDQFYQAEKFCASRRMVKTQHGLPKGARVQRIYLWGALICLLLAGSLLQARTLAAAHLRQPAVDIQINALRYDEQKNLYTLSLSISQPGFIEQLVLKVEEKEAGKQVVENFFTVGGRSTIVTELDGQTFVDEREYLIKLEGIDYAGLLILRANANNTLEPDERSTLATKEFKHTVAKAKPIVATVLNVNVDFAQQILLIDLEISDEDALQINKVEGWVIDKESGARIHEFGPNLFERKRMQEKLPSTIATATTPHDYELYLVLTTKDDQPIRTEPRSFKPTPPPPPSFFNHLTTGLNNNPTLLATVLVIMISVIGWLVIQNGQGRREPLLPPRPPINGTTVTENYSGATNSRQPGVRVSVVHTSHSEDKVSKVIYQFPCDIGREGCQLNIPHDTHISRRHARLTWRSGHYYLSDLESTNGTFVDNTPLPPKQHMTVNELSLIRLGKTTIIKIELAD